MSDPAPAIVGNPLILSQGVCDGKVSNSSPATICGTCTQQRRAAQGADESTISHLVYLAGEVTYEIIDSENRVSARV